MNRKPFLQIGRKSRGLTGQFFDFAACKGITLLTEMAGHLGHFLLFSQLFQFGSSEADQHPLHPPPGTITAVFYLALLDDLQLEALQSFCSMSSGESPS